MTENQSNICIELDNILHSFDDLTSDAEINRQQVSALSMRLHNLYVEIKCEFVETNYKKAN